MESKGVGRSAKIAKPGDLLQYAQWDVQIKNHVKQDLNRRFMVDNTMSVLPRAPRMLEAEVPEVIALRKNAEMAHPFISEVPLNKEQRCAFDIVYSHLKVTLAGRKPPQLQMLIIGEGGTGKTVVINKLTVMFASMGASNILAKTATSRVAVTFISGTTLHNWAAFPMIIWQKDGWVERPSKKMKLRKEKT